MYMHIILKYFFYLFVCLEYWNSYFVLSFFSNYLCENFYIVGLSFEFKEEKYWTALNDVICKLISNKKWTLWEKELRERFTDVTLLL